jgi:hypothetical protein
LPELALIEGNQLVATTPDESLSLSLFTFHSHFASIHPDEYYIFTTARRRSEWCEISAPKQISDRLAIASGWLTTEGGQTSQYKGVSRYLSGETSPNRT